MRLKAIFRDDPWPHLFIEEVFDSTVYMQILKHIPPLKKMKLLGGYPNRKIAPLVERQGFWGEIRAALESSELTKALSDKLGVTKECWPKAAICRDLPGYYLAPHADASFKVMTLIAYLPEDNSQGMEGIRLLKRVGGKITNIKQLGFFPNVGLAFKVTKDSWHEVGHVAQGKTRDSIQICYFDTPERNWI